MNNGNCCNGGAKTNESTETKGGCCENGKKCCCGMLCQNVGKIDRIARGVFGLALIALVFVGPQTPWGWLGLLPLASALVGWCGMYTVLGINTKKCCTKDGACNMPGQGGCCAPKNEPPTT